MKKLKLKLKEVCKDIICVKFSNYREIKQACMRFEEAYENPIYRIKKRKKSFTKKDINKWWETTAEGKKSPYWFGAFNVPSSVFKHFYKGEFDPLDKYEQALLDILMPVYKTRKRFYVIMTVTKPLKEDFAHEVAHGLYYVSKEYKNKVNKIVKEIPRGITKKLDKYLLGNGYGRHVLSDERHAILLSDSKKDIEKKGIIFEQILPARTKLNHIFKEILEKRKI